MKYSFIFLLVLCSCQSKHELSAVEMNQYQITGQVSDAQICPTEVDAQGNSRVVGPCKKVNCNYQSEKLKCDVEEPPK